jgi:putative transposase
MIKAKLENTFHVVGKTDLRKWPTDSRTTWRIFSKTINCLQKENEIITRSFVLMSNHYHWLCEYDFKDPNFFEFFQGMINCHLSEESGYQDDTLKGPPQMVRFEGKASYTNTYKYIYRNPVTAGIVFRAEDYPYSTLKFVLGESKRPFEIEDNMNIVNDPYRIVNWINAPWGEQLYFKYH